MDGDEIWVARRNILKFGLAAAVAAVVQPAQAVVNEGAIANLITAGYIGTTFGDDEDGCLNWRITGFVIVYGEVFIRLANYQPTALVEIYKSPLGSVFYESGSTASGTIVEGIQGFRSEGGFEARVWTIKDAMRRQMFFPYYNCVCHARNYPGAGAPSQIGSAVGNLNQGVSACTGPIAALTDAGQGSLQISLGEYAELSWDSALDALNWRTGCRDQGLSTFLAGKVIVECGIMNGEAAALIRTIIDALDLPINIPTSINNTDQLCIGRWGPLLPRQMRFDGASAPVVAGSLAYRALHIANRQLGTFQHEVSLGCKLQPIYPVLRPMNCLFPGCSPHNADIKVTHSGEGKYGFLWWTPHRCRKTAGQLASCFQQG